MKTVFRMMVAMMLLPVLLKAESPPAGEVWGDKTSATVTFSTAYATSYTISAKPTNGWEFATQYFSLSGYNGWHKEGISKTGASAKCEKIDGLDTLWIDAATAFSVTISGKMYKPGGTGGSLVNWSVTGSSNAATINMHLDPTTAIVALGNSQNFAYKTAAGTELYGFWWDSSKTPSFNSSNYSSTGKNYSFSHDTAGEYVVTAARNSGSDKSASASVKNVEVSSVKAGVSPNEIISTAATAESAPTYCVPKKAGTNVVITATPNPAPDWPNIPDSTTSYPTWTPNASITGASYTHPTSTAGKVAVTASCGSSSKVINIATIEVTLTRSAASICAKPAKSPIPTAWDLTTSEFEKEINVTTTPQGYEHKVDLLIESLSPTQTDKGSRSKINNSKWKYSSLTEAKSNLNPGGSSRCWTVKIKDSFSDTETSFMVKSVFAYLVTSSKTNKQNKAIEYVKWKYDGILSGKTIGTYTNSSDYGSYTALGGVKYGNPCFTLDAENILVSTMLHEHYHTTQSSTLRPLGAISMADYLINVNLGLYPDPPAVPTTAPSQGLDWAALELTAHYYERTYKNQTGIIYNSAYYARVLDWIVFFEYLSTHATGP